MNIKNSEGSAETTGGNNGFIYRILRIITVIYPGELSTALLLTLNIFLLLAAYYIIKPVRDSLMLESWPAEIKSYLSAAIVVILVFVIKIYASIASRFSRQKLITLVTSFFISNLCIFYLLHLTGIGPGAMGIIFFIWVSIFNVLVIALFWGFANDIYTEDEGKRLFPLIAFGALMGGMTGGIITKGLLKPFKNIFGQKEGEFQLLILSGVILGVCIIMTWIIHIREIKRVKSKKVEVSPEGKTQAEEEKPLEKGGAFRLVFKKRYLLYIAFFVLILNFVNTNGVYMLDTVAQNEAVKAVEAGTVASTREFFTIFFAGFYNIMNLFGIFVQLFLVSRIFKWFGVRGAVFVLPLLSLGGYFLLSFGAVVLFTRLVKAMDNSLDYSLMNTTRHSLFLITSREEKYKAQAVTKTFFHRSGDVLHAALVFVGTTYLAFRVENFAMVNVVLAVIWIFLGVLIFKEHKRLSEQRPGTALS
jgi:AAA family ATP:ADP antiporter